MVDHFNLRDRTGVSFLRQDHRVVSRWNYIRIGNYLAVFLTHHGFDGVVWFEFAELCDGPRSAFDYVELARLYETVLISGVPVFNDSRNDQARRFINLVDVPLVPFKFVPARGQVITRYGSNRGVSISLRCFRTIWS